MTSTSHAPAHSPSQSKAEGKAKPATGTALNTAPGPDTGLAQISKAVAGSASQAAHNLQNVASSALATATPQAVLNSTGRTVATWANATQRISNRVQNLGTTVVQATDDLLANAANATSGIPGQITQGASSLLPSAVRAPMPFDVNLPGMQRGMGAGTSAVLGGGSSSSVMQQGLAQVANSVTANLMDSDSVTEQDPPDDESAPSSSFTRIPPEMLSIGLPKDASAPASTPSSSAPAPSMFQRAAGPLVDAFKDALSRAARTVSAGGPIAGPKLELQNAKVEILPNSPLAAVVPKAASTIADSPVGAEMRALAASATDALASSLTMGQAPGPVMQQDKPPEPPEELDADVALAIAMQTRASLLAGSDAPAKAPATKGQFKSRDADAAVHQAIAAGASQGLHNASALDDDSSENPAQDSSVHTITSPKTAKATTAGYVADAAQEDNKRLAAANHRMAAVPTHGQIVSERQADGSARLLWAGSPRSAKSPNPFSSDNDAVVGGDDESEMGVPATAEAEGASSKQSGRSLKARIVHEGGVVEDRLAAILRSTGTLSEHTAPTQV